MGGNLRIFDLKRNVSSHLSQSTTQKKNSSTGCVMVYDFLTKPLPWLDYHLISQPIYWHFWIAVIKSSPFIFSWIETCLFNIYIKIHWLPFVPYRKRSISHYHSLLNIWRHLYGFLLVFSSLLFRINVLRPCRLFFFPRKL